MKTTPSPQHGSKSSSQLELFPLDGSINGASPRSSPKTLKGSTAATSSPVSAVGSSLSGSPDGQRDSQSGPVPRRANRTASRGKGKGTRTLETFGPNSVASSQHDDLQSSLESSLQTLLNGSPGSEVIWEHWTTPWGQSRLRPRSSGQTTGANDTILLPTPTASMQTGADLLQAMHASSDPRRLSYPVAKTLAAKLSTEVSVWRPLLAPSRLDPTWTLWRMGYPAMWHSCGVRATRSCPPSVRNSFKATSKLVKVPMLVDVARWMKLKNRASKGRPKGEGTKRP